MARPGSSGSRRTSAEDQARIRRLENAIIALAENANNATGQRQSVYDRFDRHRPPTYDGTADPIVLEGWVREMENLFVATRCPKDQMVSIASYYLKKEADNWWAIARVNECEFLCLEQATISVQAYANKFMELSRFATAVCPNKVSRVRRFEKNLTPNVRTMLAGIPSTTFKEAYDRALSVCESVRADEAETARRCRQLFHTGKTCDGTPIVCYICKKLGHKSFNCPKKPAAAKGRIFVMSHAEAESRADVIANTFLVYFILAFVLL
ncbi:hypothetical protein RND81_09G073300, partial [Saponaria officinalis]